MQAAKQVGLHGRWCMVMVGDVPTRMLIPLVTYTARTLPTQCTLYPIVSTAADVWQCMAVVVQGAAVGQAFIM